MNSTPPIFLCGLAFVAGPLASANADEPRAIREQITVLAPIDEVWNAWTTTAGVKRFFAQDAEIELRLGGKYEIYFAADAPEGSRGSEGCQVLAFLPTSMLAFSWNAPPKFPNVRKQHHQVVLLFDELAPHRTRVRLTAHGWGEGAEWDQTFEYFSNAWPYVLKNLKSTLEQQPNENTKPGDGKGEAAPAPPVHQHYLIVLRPARASFHEDATEAEQKIVGEHYQRLVQALTDGVLILAGPATDGVGPGIIVFEAGNEQEAQEFMNADPAVQAGVFTAELHPFRLSLSRSKP